MQGIRRISLRASSVVRTTSGSHNPAIRLRARQSQLLTSQPQPCHPALRSLFRRAYATESENQEGQNEYDPRPDDQKIVEEARERLNDDPPTVQDVAAGARQRVSEVASDVGAKATQTYRAAASEASARFGVDSASDASGFAKETLYVGNLSFETTDEDLMAEFEPFGEVKSARVIRDASEMSRGFAMVEFLSGEDAAKARDSLDGAEVGGRRLNVQRAKAREPRRTFTQAGFQNEPTSTVFIGNMAYQMSDEDLNNLFRNIENVTDVRVAIDRRTGQPRGYAHADFVDVESAQAAANALLHKTFYGRRLKIDFAVNKASRRGPKPSESVEEKEVPIDG